MNQGVKLVSWIGLVVVSCVPALVWGTAADDPAPLSFQDRVSCERTIQAWSWQYREWPKDNPGPKPTFDESLPYAASVARVEEIRRKESALEALWGIRIEPADLRAELERMAEHSKMPGRLGELWAMLGGDGYQVGECLARPVLVERILADRYAYDVRFHGRQKQEIEAELAGYGQRLGMDQLRNLSGRYGEVTFCREDRNPEVRIDASMARGCVALDPDEWQEMNQRLQDWIEPASCSSSLQSPVLSSAGTARVSFPSIPTNRLSPLEETADRFFVTAVREATAERIAVVSVVWDKKPLEEWWNEVRSQHEMMAEGKVYAQSLPVITAAACTDDTWSEAFTVGPTPAARHSHTAVWTGSEMVVWGGCLDNNCNSLTGTGGRYNPASDTWRATSMTGAPSARKLHTAVWTGSKVIVWGGCLTGDCFTSTNTGASYDPGTDSWAPTGASGVPSARYYHTALWTGSKMLVWGGQDAGTRYNTGAFYDPGNDTWTATSTTNAPSARSVHTAVWTGTKMIVWSGCDTSFCSPLPTTGGVYDAGNDSWTATSTASPPTGRLFFTAVWTGSKMVVWGGCQDANCQSIMFANTGGLYDPGLNSWTATATSGAPTPRGRHTAVWTGAEMIVWGGDSGFTSTGGRYNPSLNTWTATSTTGAPTGRRNHTAVWTGTEMILWGGVDTNNNTFYSGGRYDPSVDAWGMTSLGNAPSPSAREFHSVIWTGAEMIVWGGIDAIDVANTGGRYSPVTDTWIPTSTLNTPAPRRFHTAVWTGSAMIVWGGWDVNGDPLGTGGRYFPASDNWAPVPVTNAPIARALHTAVWTGTQMIVWGGESGGFENTGGRYNPVADTWASVNTAGAPTARSGHTAVWTGSKMIVWGGYGGAYENTGGRYDPSGDSWTSVNTTGAPGGRSHHTTVWTGSKMIVWGGSNGAAMNTGGRYDPVGNSWAALSTTGAPSARLYHTAVWAGAQMIIWGGFGGAAVNTGGRYTAASDSWSPTSLTGAPSARYDQTAVWTGSEMIVWGGRDAVNNLLNTGGRYCDGAAPGEPGVSPPLMVTKSGGNLVFTWGAPTGSCGPGDFALYKGDITTLATTGYNHDTQLTCTTGGVRTINISLGNPNIGETDYYLVTAVTNTEEGSYGRRSDGTTERPVSGAACKAFQNLFACSP